ncbi:enoyl-CoA hydratase/isomerase family protein [Ornithinimicrobium sp. W1665]|uniref:enoyl-CoA hydratase/isomerase family protein n=1 Tax=Ornithinimicrobium sp. W1665 TaxID=3416666 RepID=UPI003CF6C7D9
MTEVRLSTTSLGRTLVLDRPDRRNALTLPMWQELGALVRQVGDGPEPLYVVGAGGYFCSGADLGALQHARSGPDDAETFVHAVVSALLSIHALDREVVAVVEGGAAGGGVEIMAACDRRVAVGSPSLVFPFGHHGMVLDGFTRWRLHGIVGDEQAERLVDGRHVVQADEAVRLGLFDERHADLAALEDAEHRRPPTAGARPGERYLTGPAGLPEAVRRAAAPMLQAFPRHT